MKRFLTGSSSGQSSGASELSAHGTETTVEGKRKPKYRKYDERYLDFGFTCVEVNNEERPQCVICLKVLSVESMLPSKLKRHFETLHPTFVGKSTEFFKNKLAGVQQQKSVFTKHSQVNNNALLASYKVAYHVARSKKPHTIAEELILPAALDMVKTMISEDAAKQIEKVPLSNSTISRRIDDMAENIIDQLLLQLKGKEFALQLDEATDSNKDTHLICYVRFIEDRSYVEDILFCKQFEGSTTGQDLFNILNEFMIMHSIDWNKCVGICTDGGSSMAGRNKGLQALIRAKATNAIWTHCMIHREALAAEHLSKELHDILKNVIGAINFIKNTPKKARFFEQMCKDMGSDHSCVLFYSSSRWLSLGNSFARVFELRNEIYAYLTSENHASAELFISKDFLLKLAFLTDLFEKLNILNKSLQGKNTNILNLSDKVNGFQKKLDLWKSATTKGDYTRFPTFKQFVEENELIVEEKLNTVLVQYLSKLITYFDDYLPANDVSSLIWVSNPFTEEIEIGHLDLNHEECEQLIDVQTDTSLKTGFQSKPLVEFWCDVEKEYPQIARKALRVLIPFATSYLCEAGFSAVAVIKSKYRANLKIEKEVRVAVSSIAPNFNEITKGKQAHISH